MNNATMKSRNHFIIRAMIVILFLSMILGEEWVVPTVSAAALPVPTELSATNGEDGVSVLLAWKNPDNSALIASFVVYRSEDDLNFQIVGNPPATQTTFRDTGLSTNQSYYYRLASKDSSGVTSTPSASVNVTPRAEDSAPSSPLGLIGQTQSAGYEVIWNQNSEADLAGYRLYRSEDGLNFFKVQNDLLTSNHFTDTTMIREKLYYYRVSAVDQTGHESTLSASITTEMVAYVSDSNVITNGHFLTDLSDWKMGSYALYEDQADEETKWNQASFVLDSSGFSGAIKNAGHTVVGQGKAIKLEVKGASQKARTTLYQRKFEIVPTGAPVQLSFAWKKNCACLADTGTKQSLRVEMARPDSTWVKVWEDTASVNMSDYALVENLDITSSVNQSGTYDIRFIAEQRTTAGDAGAINTIRLDGIMLDLPHGPAIPKGLQVEVGKESGALHVSWQGSSDPSLEGYNLYRGELEAGPFAKLNTTPINGISYDDSGLLNGQTYYYQLKAVGSGVESQGSRAIRGVPTWIDPLQHPHHTYADNTNACASCHMNHKGRSASKTLLKESGEAKLCMTCHDGTGSKYNTKAQFTENDVAFHPVKGTVKSPEGSMSCSSCHNPHAANGKRMTPREAAGSLAMTAGVELTYSSTPFTQPISFKEKTAVSKETELCLSCHSSNPKAPVPTQTTVVAQEFHPANISGHNSVTDSQSSGFGTYVNGWSSTSVTSCTDCHGAPDTPDHQQGVHGSPITHLLKKSFTNQTKADSDGDALCFTCHDRSTYGGNPVKDTSFTGIGQTRFATKPDGAVGSLASGSNLHNFWNASLNKGHLGVTCAQCHSAVPHGTEKLPAMLVDLSDPQPYQTYTTDTNLKIYYPADGDWSNKNSCATPGSGCHLNVK